MRSGVAIDLEPLSISNSSYNKSLFGEQLVPARRGPSMWEGAGTKLIATPPTQLVRQPLGQGSREALAG